MITGCTDPLDTRWPFCPTSDCRYCTMTCTITYIDNRTPAAPVVTSTYTIEAPEPRQEEIFIEPVDPELIKLRRKQSFQKRHYRSRFYPRPRLKRKSIISISGWLTRLEYKRKKGHGKI